MVAKGSYLTIDTLRPPRCARRHLRSTHDGDDHGCARQCCDPHPPSPGSAHGEQGRRAPIAVWARGRAVRRGRSSPTRTGSWGVVEAATALSNRAWQRNISSNGCAWPCR
eukprot:5714100-Pleurochrysis_carterae.AAC.1